MIYTVFDLESDGLLDSITKIHCLSYTRIKDGNILDSGTLVKYEEILNFLLNQECLVGHNIIRYDIPALKKIINFHPPENQLHVDTLSLSWYLYPQEYNYNTGNSKIRLHGLEHYGELLGIKKPEIDNWQGLGLLNYINRCEEDVKINVKLFIEMMKYLLVIYKDINSIHSLMKYLSFKMDCLREQEEIKCKIDVVKCEEYLEEINKQISKKTEILAFYMPKVEKTKIKKKPKNYYKQDGSLSSHAIKWELLCEEHNLDKESEEHEFFSHYEEPNPNSIDQKKKWLYDLGWSPTIFIERKNSKGEIKEVEQISNEGKICENIKSLYDDYPYLENLESLTILSHRKGVFESFLKSVDDNNCVVATADGFTNTLRFMHRKPIANLTKVGKPWGKEIRSLIIRPDNNHILCGSDMSALEDTTKQHYMYFFDPEYVKEMRVPGFDPHISMGVFSNLITKEEEIFFKYYSKTKDENPHYKFTDEEDIKFKSISKRRGYSKTVNFAGVYGAGPPKLAKTLKCDLQFAKDLHTAYWLRNKAVKQVANTVTTKTVKIPNYKLLNLQNEEQMWLFNPISKFWYSLRAEKDIFSTLNQGTGVFCFDCWVREMRKQEIKIFLQYHDEIGFSLLKEDIDNIITKKNIAIENVNKLLKLNVPLNASADFGENYSQVH